MASSSGFQDFLNKHIVGPMGKFANFRFVRAVMAPDLRLFRLLLLVLCF